MKPASPAERIHLCRAYDVRAGVETTGARLLVDRLWPRGIAKADLPLDAWLKGLTLCDLSGINGLVEVVV